MASITCANCQATHQSVEGVRRCHAGETSTCSWLYEARDRWGTLRDEDGSPIIHECGALSWDTGRALVCENGHEHVWAEARQQERWDYTESREEAAQLAKFGIDAVDMQGRAWI